MVDHILGYDAEGIRILQQALVRAREEAQGFRELQTKYTNLEIEYAKARQEIEVLAPYRDAFHHMQAKMAGVEQKKQMVREALNKGGYPTFAHMMDEYYKNDYTIAGRMCWHRIQGMEEYVEERRDIGDVLDSFFITGRGVVYIVIAPEPPFFTNEIVTMNGEEYRVTGMEKKANFPEKGKNPYVFTGPIKDRLLQSILLSPIAAVQA